MFNYAPEQITPTTGMVPLTWCHWRAQEGCALSNFNGMLSANQPFSVCT